VIEQEMTMLKTISAALLAVSMLAAPAMAASAAKTVTPVTKSATFHGKHLNSHVLKAQALMKRGKHHHARHFHHHRHYAAKKMHLSQMHRH